MKNIIIILIIITLCASASSAAKKEDQYEIGQKSITYIDESRKRPLVTEIWYPSYDTKRKEDSDDIPVFRTIKTIHDASIPDRKFPLLLVSHGTGGNRFSLTWFVEKMVKEGYIVVAMDHYGNSTFNKLPREFVKWWERAIDVKYVLTKLLNEPDIGTKIDQSRIGGVGFSLGGYTHIALAGGYVNRDREAVENNIPREYPDTEEIIDLYNDHQIVSSYNQYKNHVKDERIKAFFVMAPAIGFGFHTKKQVEEITAPIFIVAGKGDTTNTPIKHNALNYHNLIETSKIHLFDKNVSHYVFLNEATEFGKKILPEITIDHPSVNRKEVHEKTLGLAIYFFKKNL